MAQAQSRLTNSNNRFKVIQTTVLIMHSRRSESSQDTTRQRLLDEGRPAWHAKIMSREMAEPTAAMDELVNRQIRPHFMYLRQVVTELLGRKTDEETIRLCCNSVVGQCLFYHFGQPVVTRLFPQKVPPLKD